MPDFRSILRDDRIYFFDGGYGTLLQGRGLPPGLSPELWGLKAPEVIRGVHQEYLEAGADILTTNTFGGSRPKLGLDADPYELNRAMTRIARQVAGDRAFVAASIGPTGHFVEPLGDLTFRELVEIFKEQIRGCVDGGADLILGETHFDLAEARAVVVAARLVCSLPVAMSMTFEGPASLTGTTPLTFVDTMQNMGVELIGTNCSAGPEQMRDTLAAWAPRLTVPCFAEANAGLPELDAEGNTAFRLGPEPFAEQAVRFVDLGAKFIGGCCGTTPEHIRAVRGKVGDTPWRRPAPTDDAQMVLTSRSVSVPVGFSHPGVIIGERINPTGKPLLTSELQDGVFAEALRFAAEQIDLGAPVLDVNVGAPMADEKILLPGLIKALSGRFTTPLSIDSNDSGAVEAGLWVYPGSPLVNSISGEPGKMEALGPLCKLFGAPFILLPIVGRKLPVTATERLAVIEDLLVEAEGLGIPRRLIMVDALALTVSSKPEAARHSMEVMRRCRDDWGLPTTIGLSNISFGLPARELLNSTFLALSMASGLCSFIANPNSARIQETLHAAEALLNRDPQAARYIGRFSDWTGGGGSQAAPTARAATDTPDLPPVQAAVIKGDKGGVVPLVEAELDRGMTAMSIVNDLLIPGILVVGEKYERKEYFLPQLLQSAETMQVAFARLKPLLEADGGSADRPVVVMATVEGDIHDIGKNIVCLMLKNYGFDVVDLGKDVAAERIVDAAQERGAAIIGLSALMTTTMVRMEDTVRLVRERGLKTKVIIGGAVVTEKFCTAIGADGWSTDAVRAVKLAQSLVA
ncbi:MAG: homocysteine S-methyltransferase family protein [Pseudodesulfovibrio sp.]|uniref:Methionine synthase n=1 Tax=Pseudodesulfovibrio aespoeensis (strain ATCC 700646 / DSM 10631 / Aspo-2) TaxID=643562 RepID=E6VR40_PSEA9|nr:MULTISPECIES: homocysteine S-methyltransferase family protein [Pseudodesulfovibrio]MBU4192164.1 homocysteine S-methyltransferase family protein [Pseudomonadota bacterium]MCG2732277.1 homocysteine S-methyltransferase family protein [Pseudodesulfovibrio aespoeensis]ADU64124.1 homocysteine S-methyltransferase [Pseudodesulfovibrio aespoeensis Aspo-2]MBU4245139.1 homocysteine S-methyltransferase family protein [Pseudomonadota bacterium]MBU4379062.1 homocysteine S-methyltransferase family protein